MTQFPSADKALSESQNSEPNERFCWFCSVYTQFAVAIAAVIAIGIVSLFATGALPTSAEKRWAREIFVASRVAIKYQCVDLARFIGPNLPLSEKARLDSMVLDCKNSDVERRLNLLRNSK